MGMQIGDMVQVADMPAKRVERFAGRVGMVVQVWQGMMVVEFCDGQAAQKRYDGERFHERDLQPFVQPAADL
jgi:ribosomal protein L21E